MKNKSVSLEMLASKIEQSRNDRIEYHDIYCKELNGNLKIKKMRLEDVLGIWETYDNDSSAGLQLEFFKELIYKSCPVLHSEKLQKKDDLTEPFDIVTDVFGDNLGSIVQVGTAILSFYGLDEQTMLEDLKN